MGFGARLTSIVKSEQTHKSLQRFAPAAKWFMAGAGKAVSFVAGADSSPSQSADVHSSAGGTPAGTANTADPPHSSPPTWGGPQRAAESSPTTPSVISAADLRTDSNGGLASLSTRGWGAGSVKSDAGSRSPATGAAGGAPTPASPLHHVAAAGAIPGHRRGWSNISGDAALGSVGSSGVPWAASTGAHAVEPRREGGSGWGAAEEKCDPGNADAARYGVDDAARQGLHPNTAQAVEPVAEGDPAAPAPRFAPAAKWLLAGAGKAMTFVVGADGKADDTNTDAAVGDAGNGASALAPAGAFDSEPSMPAVPAPVVDTSAQEAHFSGVAALLAASEGRAGSLEQPQQDGGGGGGWRGFGGFFGGRGQQQQQDELRTEEPAQGAGEGLAALASAQSTGTVADVAGQLQYGVSHDPASAAADHVQYGRYVPWGSRQETSAAPFFPGAEPEADGGACTAADVTSAAAAPDSAAEAGFWGSSAVPPADVAPGAAATDVASQAATQPFGVADYTGWGARPASDVGGNAAAEQTSPPWRSHAADTTGFDWGGAGAAAASETAAWGGHMTGAPAASVDETPGPQASWGAQDSGYSGFNWQGYTDGGRDTEDLAAGAAASEPAASEPAAGDGVSSLPQAQGALWPPIAPDSVPGLAAAEEAANSGAIGGSGSSGGGGGAGDAAAWPGSASNPPLEQPGGEAFGAAPYMQEHIQPQYGQEYSQEYQHDSGGSWGAGHGGGGEDGTREGMPASLSQNQKATDGTEPASPGWGVHDGGTGAAAAAESPQGGFLSGLAGDTAAERAGDADVHEPAQPGHADTGTVSRPPQRARPDACRHLPATRVSRVLRSTLP